MKRALVTGATRGIGKAIADALEADGCDVVRWGRKNYNLAEPREVAEAVNFVANDNFDILVNNAGFQSFGEQAMENLAADHFLMFMTPWTLARGAAYNMSKTGWGRIVNISSIAAIAGGRGCIGYDIAKAALNRLTKALAVDWAQYGITVNAVMPGFIETDMLKPLTDDAEHAAAVKGRIPAGEFGKPKDVAALVRFLCSDEARYINGAIIPVDGGWLCR